MGAREWVRGRSQWSRTFSNSITDITPMSESPYQYSRRRPVGGFGVNGRFRCVTGGTQRSSSIPRRYARRSARTSRSVPAEKVNEASRKSSIFSVAATCDDSGEAEHMKVESAPSTCKYCWQGACQSSIECVEK